MKYLSIIFLFSSFLFAQQRYSQVQIPIPSASEYRHIADLGVAVDHFSGKIGSTISVLLSESEIKMLDDAGIHYTVQIRDWQKHYDDQQLQEHFFKPTITADVPKYFRFGSMGGFLTFTEVQQQLDSMKLLFPALITAKDSIGTTIEGRTIYAVKISDNPAVNEPSEPEVLYTALHHAREPEGMMTVIYYMWWLLENYGKDPEATHLVNNRQLWFIPVVNPDGYVYNQSLNANGGSNWRKNRRVNSDATFGVDLNRNYGQFFMWNSSNAGSSTSTNSDTYRGTAPFSEPETDAIRQFMLKHQIKTCFNYHTYGNYLVYPWGYSSSESNDSLLFRQWTFDMSMYNRYTLGTDQQTVGYSTRGNSDDYMYSDSAKSRTYAITPEAGTTGFWPAKTEIYPLAQENLLQNKLLAHYAGSYVSIMSVSVNDHNIAIRLVNKGLEAYTNPKLSIHGSDDHLSSTVSFFGTLAPQSEIVVNTSYPISSNEPSAKLAYIYLQDSTYSNSHDTISIIIGKPTVLLYDSANTTALWSTGTGWGVVSDMVANSKVFTDSPIGNYSVNAENSLTLLNPIDLKNYQFAELKFKTKWSIEPTWDFALIEVSSDGGSNWNSINTQLSRKGSGRAGSKQPSSSYGYDAFNPGLTWIEQTADLTPYAGKQIKIRFRVSADGADQRDGWYIDDIRVLAYGSTSNSVQEKIIPYKYSLSQNFPNPFNPATTIQFSVEKQNRSTLHVYNAIGQEVALLLDQELDVGNYSINFSAKQLSSGVYFYRFTSGTFSSIKKMVIVK